MRYAVLRGSKVENVIAWDGVTPWAPPEGCVAVLDPDGIYQIEPDPLPEPESLP
jgi:hypothetical protein